MSKKLDALMKTMNDCTVTVIHNNGPGGPNNAVAFINMPKDLSTTAKLERAFMLTNSIDSAWYKSPEITKLFEGPGITPNLQIVTRDLGSICAYWPEISSQYAHIDLRSRVTIARLSPDYLQTCKA